MAEEDDRDALTWEGDELVDGTAADGTDQDGAEPDDHDPDVEELDESEDHDGAAGDGEAPHARASSADRVLAGVLLVLAVAAAIGWVIVAIGNPVQQQNLLGLAMYQLGELLSIVAPPLWWLTAGRLAPRPLVWRLVGLVVTAPWPLVFWIAL